MPLDENAPLDESAARHLLRRSGFGAPPALLEDFVGLTRGAAADVLLRFKPNGFKPSGKSIDDVRNKWIAYMVKVKAPLQEKLVLFWHDHFATSANTVMDTKLMALQNRTLRLNCKGHFKNFVKAMNKNAALMDYLDTNDNRKDIPNENYARELQELFTLGVKDANDQFNYTQEDVVQIARAFTGWDFTDKGVAFLSEEDHDFSSDFDGSPPSEPNRGPKVIYKSTGQFGPAGMSFTTGGEGPAEIDTVIDIIFQHRDSDMKNTVARRTARRLLEYFAQPDPSLPFIDQTVGSGLTSFDTTWDISGLLRRVFISDEFYETAQVPGPGTKKSVKWPIDHVVSTIRLLGMKPKGKELILGNTTVGDLLVSMGQVLLEPPSVFGWDWEKAWMSSTTMRSRAAFARDVSTAQNGGKTSFNPAKLIDLNLTDAGAIVDAATDRLGITDQLVTVDRDALISYLTDGGPPNTPLILGDYATRRVKLHGLFGLLLMSPAFQVH
jgi:uncharacterized protein (DUF1800 family)